MNKEKNKKIWKVLGSATEWVGRGSIGWAGAYRLFHYPSQIFSISNKKLAFCFLIRNENGLPLSEKKSKKNEKKTGDIVVCRVSRVWQDDIYSCNLIS